MNNIILLQTIFFFAIVEKGDEMVNSLSNGDITCVMSSGIKQEKITYRSYVSVWNSIIDLYVAYRRTNSVYYGCCKKNNK